MMNEFDFWVIVASSPRKGDLVRAGVRRDRISSVRAGYARYGNRSYPRKRYEASVAFVDAPLGRDALNAELGRQEAQFAGSGVSLSVKYHCSD